MRTVRVFVNGIIIGQRAYVYIRLSDWMHAKLDDLTSVGRQTN